MYEFYFACLDRIDILITERDQLATHQQLINILQTLSYFRPKTAEYKYRSDKNAGYVDPDEANRDILSSRHRELIQANKDKYSTAIGHMGKHMYENLTKGFFKDMFTDYDADEKSKMKTGLYELLQMYI